MKYTLSDFRREFPTDEMCLDRVMEMKYGGTEIECPACKRESKFHRIAKRRGYSCQFCGHHIYPCVDTPFEKSRTPLSSWFFAMYLFTSTRHGVAAKELERQLGVTYKTAWRMAHELRKLMAQADEHRPLSGHVEVDETFIGGKSKRVKSQGYRLNKTVVIGMVERDGILRAGPIKNTAQYSTHPVITRNVVRGSLISTDDWRGYRNLPEYGYRHGTVNHSAKEYVRGQHHVNTLESYWGQLKRSIRGTHVFVSSKHMWKYVSEFSFRFNHRKHPGAMFPQMVSALALPRLADD